MLICLGTQVRVSLLLQDGGTWCSDDRADVVLEGGGGGVLSGLPEHCGCTCETPARVGVGGPCLVGQMLIAPCLWEVGSLSQHCYSEPMRGHSMHVDQ